MSKKIRCQIKRKTSNKQGMKARMKMKDETELGLNSKIRKTRDLDESIENTAKDIKNIETDMMEIQMGMNGLENTKDHNYKILTDLEREEDSFKHEMQVLKDEIGYLVMKIKQVISTKEKLENEYKQIKYNCDLHGNDLNNSITKFEEIENKIENANQNMQKSEKELESEKQEMKKLIKLAEKTRDSLKLMHEIKQDLVERIKKDSIESELNVLKQELTQLCK